MKTPSDIIAFVGKDAAAAALGVSTARIERACREARLPASWLHSLERIAGQPLPRALFTFKGVTV